MNPVSFNLRKSLLKKTLSIIDTFIDDLRFSSFATAIPYDYIPRTNLQAFLSESQHVPQSASPFLPKVNPSDRLDSKLVMLSGPRCSCLFNPIRRSVHDERQFLSNETLIWSE